MPQTEIQYLAVVVAALVGMAVAAVWFSPLVFGKLEAEFQGMSVEKWSEATKGMRKLYLGSFANELVRASVLAYIIALTGFSTLHGGLAMGFFIWLGFEATTFLAAVFWDRKPFKWYIVHAGHHLVTLLLMGVIITGWRH